MPFLPPLSLTSSPPRGVCSPSFVFFRSHYLALSFYYPFVVLWMRKTGLSNASIGAINSMRGVAVLFIPLWGAVSDKYNAKMVLLIIVCIATLLRCSTTMFSSFGLTQP